MPEGKPCARCGLALAPGYVKCPRCHAEQSVARAGDAPRAAPGGGGGTAVEPGLDRRLIAAIGGGVALLVIVLVVALGGDDPASRPAEPAGDEASDDGGGEPGADDEAPEVAPPPGPAPAPVAAPAPPPASGRAGALGGLRRSLSEARLWATVTSEAATVQIDSSFCEDDALRSIVDGAIAELRDVGFTAVRCRAPHGATVFEHGL